MAKQLLTRSVGITAAIATTLVTAATAPAQEPPISTSADVPTAVNEIFFNRSGPFSRNRTFLNTDFILGVGGFPEQRVRADADAISAVSLFLQQDQATSDPTIRVPDLANPYNTSVRFLPSLSSGGRSGSEFIFEPAFLP